MAFVELKGLCKSYGSIQALDRLTLKIPQGSLFGLLGPNGSGKSTTLRIICTLISPDSGQVIFDGLNVLTNPQEVRRKLGYVAQEVALD